MLSSLYLRNFKAFGDVGQFIPIRPLTLLFGANSAGKSSIVHGLLLAHDLVLNGTLDVRQPDLAGQAVDLGGFRRYVHARDPGKTVEVGVGIHVSQDNSLLADLFADSDGYFRITFEIAERPVIHRSVVPEPCVIGITIETDRQPDEEPWFRLSVRSTDTHDTRWSFDAIHQNHPATARLIEQAKGKSWPVEEDDTADYYDGIDRLPSTVSAYSWKRPFYSRVASAPSAFWLPDGLSEINPDGHGIVQEGSDQWVSSTRVGHTLSRQLAWALQAIRDALEESLRTLTYLGPLRSVPPRVIAVNRPNDPNWHSSGNADWSVLVRDADVLKAVNTWLCDDRFMKTRYRLDVRPLLSEDAARRAITGALTSAAANDNSDISGPIPMEPSLDEIEAAVEDSQPQDEIQTPLQLAEKALQEVAARSEDQEIALVTPPESGVNGIAVSLRDVGVGISQSLPVLVRAMASSGAIVAIEQPELHLHPRLQSELGDVFLRSALRPIGGDGQQPNIFLIETHSEHLILRIMRRLREKEEGRLPSTLGVDRIKPEDISIVFVEAARGQAFAERLRVNRQGRLIDRWPGGFFEEDYEERFA